MTVTDMSKAVVSNMTDNVDDFSVDTAQLDSAGDQKETTWTNANWATQLGYYKAIPELHRAIATLVTWTVGKGWETDEKTRLLLENIRGWGEDSFDDVLKNMLTMKKVAGDAFAEIIRNDAGSLINLKPLDPGAIKIVVNSKGIIQRYEQISKIKGKKAQKFSPQKILHLSNERIGDEIHGISIIDVCETVILARNELIADDKKVMHRNVVPVRIIEVDSDDETKIAKLKTQYEEAINKGEVLIIPKGNVSITTDTPVLQDALSRIRYYEDFFYQAVGVPKVMMSTEGTTEASGKVGFLTFEPIYTSEQVSLEKDLWNQVAIKLKFNRPPSLGGDLNRDEAKDTGQMGIQPADTTVGGIT